MMRMTVDLPEPLGPSSPVTDPGGHVNETSSSTDTAPYIFDTWQTSTPARVAR